MLQQEFIIITYSILKRNCMQNHSKKQILTYVHSVTTKPTEHTGWISKLLEELGVKGALGKIWMELKDEGNVRIEKRKVPEDMELTHVFRKKSILIYFIIN